MKPSRNWLGRFLRSSIASFDSGAAMARWEAFCAEHAGLNRAEAVRRFLEQRLRQTGLVYGTPLASVDTLTRLTAGGASRRRATFMAILKLEVDLVLELGCAVGHCAEPSRQLGELLVCLALLRNRWRLARHIDRTLTRATAADFQERLDRLARRVERDLWRQAYLAGNPLLGLPVHNSLAYVDAKTLGRLAIAYYEHGLDERALRRVLDYRDQERELLLRAMVGLTLADRPLDAGSLSVMSRQLRLAGIPRRARRRLDILARGRLEPAEVAAMVGDDRARDFLIEQVLLGAMLDGHFSRRESVFISDLAGWLGVGSEELARREAEVLAFYEGNKDYLDLFMVGSAVRFYRQRWLGRLQNSIRENLERIVSEIASTRQLAELLAKASRGEPLTRQQRREMTRRLIDILRAIPSLAIFALPGGAVLLPLVFKLLPDELKPRSFVDRQATDGQSDPLEEKD